jgi:F-type H+-transporting ATPase subunit b
VEKILYLFASSANPEESSGGVFGALGIDWKVLILQMVAFGLLVFILAKWVYPPILAMLDRRQKLIEDSVKAAKEATKKAEGAEAKIADQLKTARAEAADIVTAAREQSTQILLDADQQAQKRADATVEAARQQLAKDVEAARQSLRGEVVELVALASEKVVGSKVDASSDGKIIARAIADSTKEKS